MQRTNIAEVKSEDFVLVKDIISDYFKKSHRFQMKSKRNMNFLTLSHFAALRLTQSRKVN